MVLALSCLVELMVVLDASVVNVALPAIRGDLGFGADDLTWVVNGYAIAFAGLLLLGGRLGDLRGRRRVLLAGLTAFVAASAAGGLAATPEVLVAARVLQGAGAALLAPASLAILTTAFPHGARRARALGAWTAVAVAGGALGNVLGGVLTDAFSWRWVLLINLPIGVVVLWLARRTLAGSHARRAQGDLDVPGAAIATPALGALTYGLIAASWPFAACGVAGLLAFAAWERRAPSALLPVALVRRRAIAVGNVVLLITGAALMPMWFFLTLRMQDLLGYTPLQTGLGFLPHAAITIAASMRLAPWLSDRIDGRKLVAAGTLTAAAGFAWQASADTHSGYVAAILGPAIPIGIGGGVLNTPLTSIATSGAHEHEAGAASGLVNTTKQVGAAVGLAALSATTTANSDAFWLMAAALLIAAALSLALPPTTRTDQPNTRTHQRPRRPSPRPASAPRQLTEP